ncbi:MAG: hypothetical protein ACT4OQ_00610 [Chloroflexota bacterium]
MRLARGAPGCSLELWEKAAGWSVAAGAAGDAGLPEPPGPSEPPPAPPGFGSADLVGAPGFVDIGLVDGDGDVDSVPTVTAGPLTEGSFPWLATAWKVVDQLPCGSSVEMLHVPLLGVPLARSMGSVRPATSTVTESAGKPPT